MIKYCNEYWNDIALVSKEIPHVERIFGKKILITGGSGMICSAVTEILFYLNQSMDANIQIILAGRNRERYKKRFQNCGIPHEFAFVSYDATVESELNVTPDYIIHGASNANPIAYTNEPVETILANIIGLNSMLKLGVSSEIERLLYISSSEVYGKRDNAEPYQEDDYGFVDTLNCRACYPVSKRTAENLCIAYTNEHKLDTVIVRPGHIYGPSISESDTRASAQFTRNVYNSENIVMKSLGLQSRSYCYTLDCASAILAVLLNGKSGEAYNISNKKSIVSIRDIAEALAKSAGRKVVFENPSDTEKRGYNLMSNSSLDASKLEELGWNAVFGLQDGAKRTLQYYIEDNHT